MSGPDFFKAPDSNPNNPKISRAPREVLELWSNRRLHPNSELPRLLGMVMGVVFLGPAD